MPFDATELTVTARDRASLSGGGAKSNLVLVLEDDPVLRRSARRILERAGHGVVEASTLHEARAVIREGTVDLVLLDLGLPDGNGVNFLADVSRQPQAPAFLVLTGSAAREDLHSSLRAGAVGYLHKPVDAMTLEGQVDAALLRLKAERAAHEHRSSLQNTLGDVQALLDEMPRKLAEGLCSAWDLRHVETGAHVRRIGAYTEVLAQALGTSIEQGDTLARAAMLHDIGKIAIPDAILTKPAKLTTEEFEIMKRHTVVGAKLLGGVRHPFVELAAMIARSHHERWDGSGYPDGLRAEECPFEARVVAVADVYDALGQTRCYKPRWSNERIVEYFMRESGTLFERRIVDALLDSLPSLREIALQFPEQATVSCPAPADPCTATACPLERRSS